MIYPCFLTQTTTHICALSTYIGGTCPYAMSSAPAKSLKSHLSHPFGSFWIHPYLQFPLCIVLWHFGFLSPSGTSTSNLGRFRSRFRLGPTTPPQGPYAKDPSRALGNRQLNFRFLVESRFWNAACLVCRLLICLLYPGYEGPTPLVAFDRAVSQLLLQVASCSGCIPFRPLVSFFHRRFW